MLSSFCFLRYSSAILIFILGSFQVANAYPTGAGTCEAGPAVYSYSPHLEEYGKGTLSDGGYTTSFVNGTYHLEATGSGNFFRGFLFRLSSNDTSALGAFKLQYRYSNFTQLMKSTGEAVGSLSAPATCEIGVAGVTHTENSNKTAVSVRLSLKGGFGYTMMVTVVKQKDEWYYSEEFYSITSAGTAASSPTPPTANKVSGTSVAPTSSSTATLLPTPTPVSTPTSSTTPTDAQAGPTPSAPVSTPTASATTTEAPVGPTPSASSNQMTSSSSTVRVWNIIFIFNFVSFAWLLL